LSADATRAAYTCAVAIHADNGDLETARKIGEEELTAGADEHILKVMARVYWALWQETRLVEYRDRWSRVGEALEAFDAAA
jgi:hypothetical protein